MGSMNREKTETQRFSGQDWNWAQICMIAILVLSIAAIGLMAFWNRQPSGSRYTYTKVEDIWYLEESEMAIAAPSVAEDANEP